VVEGELIQELPCHPYPAAHFHSQVFWSRFPDFGVESVVGVVFQLDPFQVTTGAYVIVLLKKT